MIGKSPDRYLRRSNKHVGGQHFITTVAAATDYNSVGGVGSTYGVSGSSTSALSIAEKRLRSLDSRGNQNNRHFNSSILNHQQQQQQHQQQQQQYLPPSEQDTPALLLLSADTRKVWHTEHSHIYIETENQSRGHSLDVNSGSNGAQACATGGTQYYPSSASTSAVATATASAALVSSQNSSSIKRKKKWMQVYVRVRPLNPREIGSRYDGRRAVQTDSASTCIMVCTDSLDHKLSSPSSTAGSSISQPSSAVSERIFEMTRVFGEDSTNEEIFKEVMRDDIQRSLFDGFNCTCFVYGMTGAGKTYTMFGDMVTYLTMDANSSSVKGLIMLSLRTIIEESKARKQQQETSTGSSSIAIRMSYLEIYNESIRDLLSSNEPEHLMVVEDPQRGVFVPELTECEVLAETDILQVIRVGNARRQMAATGQNEFSSRSHAILTFYIEQTAAMSSASTDVTGTSSYGKSSVTNSKLCLVDLAGSERAATTENRGIRLQEGANINKSLLALGNCINILADTSKKGAFVPYRDSKLTRLLKDSLGGNTQTYMISCISPAVSSIEETLNTLKYAQRARKIEKTVTQNRRLFVDLDEERGGTAGSRNANATKYLSIIEQMRREIESLKGQLAEKSSSSKSHPQPQMMATAQQTGRNNFTKKEQPQQQQPQSRQQQQLQSSPPAPSLYLPLRSTNTLQQPIQLYNETSHNTPAQMVESTSFYSESKPSARSSLGQTSPPQNSNGVMLNPHELWEEGESFSSSGKSVRISCTGTSSNGSVVLFKRSSSPHQYEGESPLPQTQASPSSIPAANIHVSSFSSDRSTEEAASAQLQALSAKFIKNLEENWEIKQSLIELRDLQQENAIILDQKSAKLKELKGKLISWMHESETTALQSSINQLRDIISSNAVILGRMEAALVRNEEQKTRMQEEMVTRLQQCSEHTLLRQLTATCETLKHEKTDLHQANKEIKHKQHMMHSQIVQKTQQLKAMEKQLKVMQAQIEEKNQIISQNHFLLKQLLPSEAQPGGAVAVRSVSPPAVSKKVTTALQGGGYFDFKKQQQQQQQQQQQHMTSMSSSNVSGTQSSQFFGRLFHTTSSSSSHSTYESFRRSGIHPKSPQTHYTAQAAGGGTTGAAERVQTDMSDQPEQSLCNYQNTSSSAFLGSAVLPSKNKYSGSGSSSGGGSGQRVITTNRPVGSSSPVSKNAITSPGASVQAFSSITSQQCSARLSTNISTAAAAVTSSNNKMATTSSTTVSTSSFLGLRGNVTGQTYREAKRHTKQYSSGSNKQHGSSLVAAAGYGKGQSKQLSESNAGGTFNPFNTTITPPPPPTNDFFLNPARGTRIPTDHGESNVAVIDLRKFSGGGNVKYQQQQQQQVDPSLPTDKQEGEREIEEEEEEETSVSDFLRTDEFPAGEGLLKKALQPQPAAAAAAITADIPKSLAIPYTEAFSQQNLLLPFMSKNFNGNSTQPYASIILPSSTHFSKPPVSINLMLTKNIDSTSSAAMAAENTGRRSPRSSLYGGGASESNFQEPLYTAISLHGVGLAYGTQSSSNCLKSPLRSKRKTSDSLAAATASAPEPTISASSVYRPGSLLGRSYPINNLLPSANQGGGGAPEILINEKNQGLSSTLHRVPRQSVLSTIGGVRCVSVSPPLKTATDPAGKVSVSVQEVIEKQKQKRSEEAERHLILESIASDILNPRSASSTTSSSGSSSRQLVWTPSVNRTIPTAFSSFSRHPSQNGIIMPSPTAAAAAATTTSSIPFPSKVQSSLRKSASPATRHLTQIPSVLQRMKPQISSINLQDDPLVNNNRSSLLQQQQQTTQAQMITLSKVSPQQPPPPPPPIQPFSKYSYVSSTATSTSSSTQPSSSVFTKKLHGGSNS